MQKLQQNQATYECYKNQWHRSRLATVCPYIDHVIIHTMISKWYTIFPRLILHPRLVPQCGTIQIQTTLKW